MKRVLFIILGMLLFSSCAIAGTTTTNGYFYLPAVGASGASEHSTWLANLEATDAILKTTYDKASTAYSWGNHASAGYLTSESDPQVSTIYATKWCIGNSAGTAIQCTQDEPVGSSGEVTDVGDCSSGACFDGTSDGGTYLKLYDADGAGQIINGNLTAVRTWTLPDSTGTFALTNGNIATSSSLYTNPTDCGANTWASSIDASGNLTCAGVTYAGITAMTSANFAGLISDETGSGAIAFANTATLLTPVLTLADGNGSAPTTDGSIKYDRTTERLQVGTGAATSSFAPVGTLTNAKYCTYSESGKTIVCNSEGGTGTISGPATSTVNAIAKWNVATGSSLANSSVLIDSSDNLTVPGNIAVGNTTSTARLSATTGMNFDPDNDATSEITFSTAGLITSVGINTGSGTATISTLAGAVDAGGATSLEIPNGTAGVVDATGELTWDTTDSQLIAYGSTLNVFSPLHEKCFTIENPLSTDDGIPIWTPADAITTTSIYAIAVGNTTTFYLSDGTNNTESIISGLSGQADDGSIVNGTFNAGETVKYYTVAVGSSATYNNVCQRYMVDRQ
jgi:hypothetical protein